MVRIISDSSTLYSIEEGKQKNVDIVPLSVTIAGQTYLENEEIDAEELVNLIKEGNIPSSSQPAVGRVIDLYNKYDKEEIINITMADGLSGTYNSACMAKKLCDNESHNHNIEVINSKTLCAPLKYIVDTATKLAEMGQSKNEIIDAVNSLIETSKSFLIPNDFDYLVRGGRLSSIAGKIAGVMKIFPIITLSEDCKSLVKFSVKRTLKKSIEKICSELKECGVDNSYKIFISHGLAEESAIMAENIVREHFSHVEIEIYKLSPVLITQGGPGCLAVQTIKKYNK